MSQWKEVQRVVAECREFEAMLAAGQHLHALPGLGVTWLLTATPTLRVGPFTVKQSTPATTAQLLRLLGHFKASISACIDLDALNDADDPDYDPEEDEEDEETEDDD